MRILSCLILIGVAFIKLGDNTLKLKPLRKKFQKEIIPVKAEEAA